MNWAEPNLISWRCSATHWNAKKPLITGDLIYTGYFKGIDYISITILLSYTISPNKYMIKWTKYFPKLGDDLASVVFAPLGSHWENQD